MKYIIFTILQLNCFKILILKYMGGKIDHIGYFNNT